MPEPVDRHIKPTPMFTPPYKVDLQGRLMLGDQSIFPVYGLAGFAQTGWVHYTLSDGGIESHMEKICL